MNSPTISFSSLSKIGITAALGAAFLAAGMFVHADAGPIISTQIHNASDAVVTSATIGSSVHDVASVASSTGGTPTGTVDFNVYPNTSCSGSPTTTQTAVGLVNGFATSSTSVVPATGLSYKVHYNGDSGNIAADGTCEPLAAISNNVSLATTLSSSTVNIGTAVHDSAVLSGVTSNATGTVTYTAYTNNTCAAFGAIPAGIKTVANGIVPDSDPLQLTSYEYNTYTFYWQAVYSGDQNNVGATSPCLSEPLVVNKYVPVLSTQLSTTSASIGTSVHDSTTITGASADASGTIAYTVYTNVACTASLQGAGTRAVTNGITTNSDSIQFNNAGIFYWQAVYSGDAHNTTATSTCQSEVLTVNSPSQTITTIATTLSTTTPVLTGTSVHDSATLTNRTANAGGTVSYKVYTDNACTALFQGAGVKSVVNGVASDSDTVQFNSAGTFYWQAIYSGDVSNNAATSSCQSEILTVVAPVVPQGASLSGTVYNDVNKNGVKDASETGLAGFTINLYASANFNGGSYSNQLKVAVSDVNGNYSFGGLANGTYSIEQVKFAGWKQFTSDYKSVTVSGAVSKSGLDFGEVAAASSTTNGHKCDGDNDSDDKDCQSGSSKDGHHKFDFRGNHGHDNGFHFGWNIGKGNQGKEKHGKDD